MNITFKQIADHAGVPQSSCYHFFANRTELLLAMWMELTQDFRDIVFAPVDAGRDWRKTITIVLERAQNYYATNTAARRLLPAAGLPSRLATTRDARGLQNADRLLRLLREQCALPSAAQQVAIFDWALKLAEGMFAWSVLREHIVTDYVRREATRAVISYLSNYIPPYVYDAPNELAPYPDHSSA